MIYFGLLFIRLSRPHDLEMVLNESTRVDFAYFLCYFFNNFFFCKFHHATFVPTRTIEIELRNLF